VRRLLCALAVVCATCAPAPAFAEWGAITGTSMTMSGNVPSGVQPTERMLKISGSSVPVYGYQVVRETEAVSPSDFSDRQAAVKFGSVAATVPPVDGGSVGCAVVVMFTAERVGLVTDGKLYHAGSYNVNGASGWWYNASFPTFKRSSAVNISGLNAAYPKGWDGQVATQTAGETTVSAQPLTWSQMPTGYADRAGLLTIYAAVPSTSTPDTFEWRQMWLYRDGALMGRSVLSGTSPSSAWGDGLASTLASGSHSLDAMIYTGPTDGGYPSGYASLKPKVVDAAFAGAAVTYTGSDARLVYAALGSSVESWPVAPSSESSVTLDPAIGDDSGIDDAMGMLPVWMRDTVRKFMGLFSGLDAWLWPLGLFDDISGGS